VLASPGTNALKLPTCTVSLPLATPAADSSNSVSGCVFWGRHPHCFIVHRLFEYDCSKDTWRRHLRSHGARHESSKAAPLCRGRSCPAPASRGDQPPGAPRTRRGRRTPAAHLALLPADQPGTLHTHTANFSLQHSQPGRICHTLAINPIFFQTHL